MTDKDLIAEAEKYAEAPWTSLDLINARAWLKVLIMENRRLAAALKRAQVPDGWREARDRQPYYGDKSSPYEAIKVIRAWNLNFSLGNVLKYVARAGKKPGATRLQDLQKARDYLDEEIASEAAKMSCESQPQAIESADAK